METVNGIFLWLLRASWQASVLVGLVLLAQWLFRRWLSPGWRWALWLIVVARLALPVLPQSPFSLFNLARLRPETPGVVRLAAGNAGAAQSVAPAASAPGGAASPAATAATAATTTPPGATAPRETVTTGAGGRWASERLLRAWLPWIWLMGAGALLMRMVWQNTRFARRVLRQRQVTDTEALEALEDGRQSMNLRTPLTVIETAEVQSPALYGFIRPRLVLPRGTLAAFNRQELFYIFLHELAHVKRCDMAVNWLINVLGALHWFNPVLWFAFRRMAEDREVATDAVALDHAPAGGQQPYGRTIIKLLESFTLPTAVAGVVGILEDKQQMQKRITMIAQFKKMSGWSAAAASLVLGLGIVTLTDGQTSNTTGKQITPLASATIRNIASSTDDDAWGMLSPDETAIAYVAWGAKSGPLVVKELRTGEKRVLADRPGSKDYSFADDVLWSPDSKSIAYSWYEDGNNASLRIISREGGESKVVKKEGEEQIAAWDWSSDGKTLLGGGTFAQAGRPTARSLATLNLTTGEIRPLVTGGRHPRFSPDGKFIVYEADGDVFALTVNGSKKTRLTDSPAADRAPIFSGDGRYVLFNSNRRGSWALWAITVGNGEPVGDAFPVKYDFGDYDKYRTAAGNLTFTTTASGTTKGGAVAYDVYVLNASSREVVEKGNAVIGIKGSLGRNFQAAWSPDGKQLAFIRDLISSAEPSPTKRHALCVQSIGDGAEKIVPIDSGTALHVFWSPDQKSLVLSRGMHDNNRLNLISLESLTMTAQSFATGWPLGFSEDGREFILVKPKGAGRVALNLETGAERTLSSPAEMAVLPSIFVAGKRPTFDLSHDGSMVAYVDKSSGEQRLIVADTKFQNQRVLRRLTEPELFTQVCWSPDRTKLAYYIIPREGYNTGKLHVVAADGSWDAEVNSGANKMRTLVAPTWSPDGTKLAFTLMESLSGQLSVLSNYLPQKLAAK